MNDDGLPGMEIDYWNADFRRYFERMSVSRDARLKSLLMQCLNAARRISPSGWQR